MSQLMLVNPRRKKARRKMTAKQAKYFGGGRRRRRSSVRAAAAPRRRRRSSRRASVTVRARRNPTARAVRRLRRRSSGGSRSFGGLVPSNLIKGTIIPAAMGGAGAIVVDVAWGFAPLPANIKTGPLAPVAKIAAAILVGAVASKVAGKAMGEKVTSGYLTVMAYNLLKGIVAKAVPSLPLGDYDMGYVNAAQYVDSQPGVGAYITDQAGGVGAYLNEYDNSYNG